MDVHPIIVHYPIALLTLYSLFELISIRRLQDKPYWFYVKAIFLIMGELGAISAVISSRFAVHYTTTSDLVMAHQRFGYATAILFGILAIMYSQAWFGSSSIAHRITKLVFDRWIMIPLAIAGLLLIIITGGLGGAIVYGTNFDPFMAPIFKLLNVY